MTVDQSERLLSRAEASEFLARHGFRVSPVTLAKKSYCGEGPEIVRFGRNVLYAPAKLLDWAFNRSMTLNGGSEAPERGQRLANANLTVGRERGR